MSCYPAMVTFRRAFQGIGLADKPADTNHLRYLQFAICQKYRYYVGVLMVPKGKVEVPAFDAGSRKRPKRLIRLLDPFSPRLDYALPCNP